MPASLCVRPTLFLGVVGGGAFFLSLTGWVQGDLEKLVVAVISCAATLLLAAAFFPDLVRVFQGLRSKKSRGA